MAFCMLSVCIAAGKAEADEEGKGGEGGAGVEKKGGEGGAGAGEGGADGFGVGGLDPFPRDRMLPRISTSLEAT